MAAARISIPIYIQIANTIRRRIRTGKLNVGDRLESERQIATNFGVSLMTARQALQSLEEEGLLERKHGSGTFVRRPPINWNRLMSFTEQMALRKVKASSVSLGASVSAADDETTEDLHVAPGVPLLHVERVRLGDGEPLALEICVLPLNLFPGLENRPLDRGSLFEILECDYGVRLSHAEETIEARPADKRTARLLGIDAHSPTLYLKQHLFAEDGRPVGIAKAWYRGDKNVFKVTRTRWGSGPPVAPHNRTADAGEACGETKS